MVDAKRRVILEREDIISLARLEPSGSIGEDILNQASYGACQCFSKK